MIVNKFTAFAIMVASNTIIYPHISLADGFNGSDLLEWSQKNQQFYFEVSVSMAGVIAAQSQREQAQCIDEWHAGQHERQYEEILEAIRTHPTFHPQGVIFAVLRKACGAFG